MNVLGILIQPQPQHDDRGHSRPGRRAVLQPAAGQGAGQDPRRGSDRHPRAQRRRLGGDRLADPQPGKPERAPGRDALGPRIRGLLRRARDRASSDLRDRASACLTAPISPRREAAISARAASSTTSTTGSFAAHGDPRPALLPRPPSLRPHRSAYAGAGGAISSKRTGWGRSLLASTVAFALERNRRDIYVDQTPARRRSLAGLFAFGALLRERILVDAASGTERRGLFAALSPRATGLESRRVSEKARTNGDRLPPVVPGKDVVPGSRVCGLMRGTWTELVCDRRRGSLSSLFASKQFSCASRPAVLALTLHRNHQPARAPLKPPARRRGCALLGRDAAALLPHDPAPVELVLPEHPLTDVRGGSEDVGLARRPSPRASRTASGSTPKVWTPPVYYASAGTPRATVRLRSTSAR